MWSGQIWERELAVAQGWERRLLGSGLVGC